MKTLLKVFNVSEKDATFAVAEVIKEVNNCRFPTGHKGRFRCPEGTKVGDTIDMGEATVTSLPDPSNDKWHSLIII